MKVKKTPDLRVVLALFVGSGILFGSLSQDLLNNPANTITKNTAKLDSSTAVRILSQGRFVNVSNTVTSPDKDAKQQAVFSELQPPTEYFPSLSVNFLLPDRTVKYDLKDTKGKHKTEEIVA